MGRWGDGEMGRWGDGEILIKGNYLDMISDGFTKFANGAARHYLGCGVWGDRVWGVG
ncbi:hypothetical protein [Moorena sp. SIO4G3]|uniref:hypothetical protein n=1 Tax=Moorena sp. SIO4G3 TaxID=2607821 RepID=UPI0025DBA62D|nr:hypothetical protein [Moorena sp. SIO4G3]